jgi:hypothetical protein
LAKIPSHLQIIPQSVIESEREAAGYYTVWTLRHTLMMETEMEPEMYDDFTICSGDFLAYFFYFETIKVRL